MCVSWLVGLLLVVFVFAFVCAFLFCFLEFITCVWCFSLSLFFLVVYLYVWCK